MLPHDGAATGHTIEGNIEFLRKGANPVGEHETGARGRHVSHRAYDDGIRVITPDHPLRSDPFARIHSPFNACVHQEPLSATLVVSIPHAGRGSLSRSWASGSRPLWPSRVGDGSGLSWRNVSHFARAAPDFDVLQTIAKEERSFLQCVLVIASVQIVNTDRDPLRSDKTVRYTDGAGLTRRRQKLRRT
jgi:hypothetical protein